MSIKDIDLQLFMHGMEIYTINYDNIMNRHLKLYGITDENWRSSRHKSLERYWFRETNKRRRDEEVKESTYEASLSDSDRLLRSEYQEIRDSIRGGLMHQYIANFVHQHIHSYEDLLQFGRYVLSHIHKNKDHYIDTPTGVENSLYSQGDWPILQMIELNNWIYTTASTNYPCGLFQNMFIYGYLSKAKALKLKKVIETATDGNKLEFIIDYKYRPGQPIGIGKKLWTRDFIQIRIHDPELTNRNLYTRLISYCKLALG